MDLNLFTEIIFAIFVVALAVKFLFVEARQGVAIGVLCVTSPATLIFIPYACGKYLPEVNAALVITASILFCAIQIFAALLMVLFWKSDV